MLVSRVSIVSCPPELLSEAPPTECTRTGRQMDVLPFFMPNTKHASSHPTHTNRAFALIGDLLSVSKPFFATGQTLTHKSGTFLTAPSVCTPITQHASKTDNSGSCLCCQRKDSHICGYCLANHKWLPCVHLSQLPHHSSDHPCPRSSPALLSASRIIALILRTSTENSDRER